jgi:glycosyltransferase involved in cell wall biosynthesis
MNGSTFAAITLETSRPLRILNVLGQRPGFTGSGILVQELWKCGAARGDQQRLVCAGYPGDNWFKEFGSAYSLLTFTKPGARGDLPFLLPGMSDVMPYASARYRDLSAKQLKAFITGYRRSLFHAIREFRPNLLHIHHLWALTGLWRVAKDIPCVVTVHGTDLKLAKTARKHRHFVARNINGIDHLFCVSKDMASDAAQEYRIGSEKMSVLGNGYNPQTFRVPGPEAKASGKIVLCAGKFVGWKGFRFAIRASARVRTPHQLVILGTGTDQECIALKTQAAKCRVTVLFPGHVSPGEVAKWMRRADVFVLPSIHEPFGLVLLEAIACGCKVVASASGGPKDIISPAMLDRGYAHLIPALNEEMPDDEDRYVQNLADAIRSHLEERNSKKVRPAIAALVDGITWESVYERMRTKYIELINQRRRPAF